MYVKQLMRGKFGKLFRQPEVQNNNSTYLSYFVNHRDKYIFDHAIRIIFIRLPLNFLLEYRTLTFSGCLKTHQVFSGSHIFILLLNSTP